MAAVIGNILVFAVIVVTAVGVSYGAFHGGKRLVYKFFGKQAKD